MMSAVGETAVGQHRVDGARAWVVAAAAAVSTFAVFGVAYSFGAFFREMSDEFGTSSSATAFVFSLTVSMSFFFGLFTGRWADRVGPRPVVLAAAASLCAGLLATSRVSSIWLGYLTCGLGVGFAVACGYVPMVSTVGGWFERKRATALGVAVAVRGRITRRDTGFVLLASLVPVGASVVWGTLAATRLGEFCQVCVGMYVASGLILLFGLIAHVRAAPGSGSRMGIHSK